MNFWKLFCSYTTDHDCDDDDDDDDEDNDDVHDEDDVHDNDDSYIEADICTVPVEPSTSVSIMSCWRTPLTVKRSIGLHASLGIGTPDANTRSTPIQR